MRRRAMHFLAVCAVAALCGCPQKGAVWIVPGSSADSLAFGVGRRMLGPPHDRFMGLRVEPCSGDGTGDTRSARYTG